MQITFDPTNTSDLKILSALFSSRLSPQEAQPEVADNTGTVVLATSPLAEDNGVAGVAQEAAPAPEKAPRKPRNPKKEASAPQIDVAEPEAAEEAPAQAEPVVEAKPLTLDEVRAALQQFTAANGVPAGIELLKGFNAGRISELSAEQYGDFVKACAA